MCADLNLPLLGKVPLDPRIARSCDEGRSFLNQVPDSPAAAVFQSIVQSEFFHERVYEEPEKHRVFVFFWEDSQHFEGGGLSTTRAKYVIVLLPEKNIIDFDDWMVYLMSQFLIKCLERGSDYFTNRKQSTKGEDGCHMNYLFIYVYE